MTRNVASSQSTDTSAHSKVSQQIMRPLFLFAPGAGAPSTHPWMQRWEAHLKKIGDVETFDYPYMRQNRKRPDPLPQLIAAHRHALAEALAKTGATAHIILIGKS